MRLGASVAASDGMRTRRSERGFSLLEALIAIVITTTAFTAAIQLLMQASAATRRARLITRAAILAASKMEELGSLRYTVGDDGVDLQDEGLTESAVASLDHDVGGYCDWFDSAGRPIGGRERPPGAMFARRWSIRALDEDGDMLAVQVLVTSGGGPPLAIFTAIRTRRDG
jgi:type II secretory pathway pseudopilin PulG